MTTDGGGYNTQFRADSSQIKINVPQTDNTSVVIMLDFTSHEQECNGVSPEVPMTNGFHDPSSSPVQVI